MKPSTKNPRRPGKIVAVRGSKTTPPGDFPSTLRTIHSGDFWRWGANNNMPAELSLMSRRSTTHRRILNDKADYISGRGFTFDTDGPSGEALTAIVERANGQGDSLRQIFNRLAFDKMLFGNAFLEIVTDDNRSFLSLFHQDASRCRVAKTSAEKPTPAIILHHDWSRFRPREARYLPLWPSFERGADGFSRSILHFKDYEPMFTHYGVPSYIAGMNVSSITWKTDQWNISRLENSFQLSGVMMLDGSADNESSASEILRTAERKFSGNPGQVMFMLKDGSGGDDGSRFIPISSDNEGDWRELHDQATTDIVVAHSWFRSLSGLHYPGGFSDERIKGEYEIALDTIIKPEQAELLEPLRRVMKRVMGIDAASLDVINTPPLGGRPAYMKVWEARKLDGLEYDPNDPAQQQYVVGLAGYLEHQLNKNL